jgi:hypothetical protein
MRFHAPLRCQDHHAMKSVPLRQMGDKLRMLRDFSGDFPVEINVQFARI